MFRIASDAASHDIGVGFAQELTAAPFDAIGKIQTAIGPVAVMRAGGVVVQASADDPVYQGDTIETGADGAVAIIFADGTVFYLSATPRWY